jgi:hypothetical protein
VVADINAMADFAPSFYSNEYINIEALIAG